MTICAAVMCRVDKKRRQDAILCISDRMLTWGDEYQAQTKHKTKAFGLSPANALAFYTGNSNQHFAIVTKTHQRAIGEEITDVEKVARWYSRNLKVFEKEEGEAADIQAIVAGFDSGGPHIYRVDEKGYVRCFDDNGYCVIGSGTDLFASYFDRSGYTRFLGMHDALWLMYVAKGIAEADPFVGNVTDIFMICDGDNGRLPNAAKALKTYHKELDAKEREIIRKMRNDLRFRLVTEP